jgi:TolB-like protein/Flp pilus assembly protein TadD
MANVREDAMPAPVPVTPESIHRQIERILASRRFVNSERLRRLLGYLLEQTLKGRAGQLKEYVLGVEVFDRGKDFDPQADAIVRSELSRLRARLRDYYANDGREDALIIDLPNRSLSLTFQPREAPAASLTPLAARFRLNSKRMALAISIIGLAALWAVTRIYNRPAQGQMLNSNPTSLAVLPFVNVGGDAATESFSDGLTEELIHRLAEIDELKVVSRTSAFQFKGKHEDLRSIAAQLNVEVVLEGSVRRSGERLRVTARLVNGTDGYELLSSVYDRAPEDILTIQQEIASQVASTLRVYQVGRRGIPIRQYTKSLSAYRLYLKGIQHANDQSQMQLSKAIECYEQAIAADPNYAPAHARLADTYIVLSLLNEISPDKAYPRAKAAAQWAVKTGEGLSEAHSALGSVLALYDWDWAGADKEFRKALELDPNDSGIVETYVMRYLLPRGRLESSLFEMQRAQRLDPFSPQIVLGLGTVHCFQRNPDGAIKLFQKVLHLEPSFKGVPLALACAYIQKSLFDQALNSLQEASAPTEDEAHLAVLGYLYARSDQPNRARQVFQQLRELSGNRYVSGYYFALIRLALGEKAEALDWLEKAAAERSPLIVYLNVNPLFDSLRAEPRFTALLKKMGLANR